MTPHRVLKAIYLVLKAIDRSRCVLQGRDASANIDVGLHNFRRGLDLTRSQVRCEFSRPVASQSYVVLAQLLRKMERVSIFDSGLVGTACDPECRRRREYFHTQHAILDPHLPQSATIPREHRAQLSSQAIVLATVFLILLHRWQKRGWSVGRFDQRP